ncbi:MAG: transketolase [Chloroflexi bacterium]|nr:transketolase [Chloroflexota bacterium]
MDSERLAQLAGLARHLRRTVLEMIAKAGSGHPGGSLSAADLLTALYFYPILRYDPQDPTWPDRDRFILSKGHAAPIVYAALMEVGYLSYEELPTLRRLSSRLQGHTDMTLTPGVEMSAGSLGQGLSFAIGVQLAARMDGKDSRSYVLLGDGECQEGQVWEAAMAAAHYRLDTLTAIIDRNGIQNDDFVERQMSLGALADKWRAFGWQVWEVDGHDMRQVVEALLAARTVIGRPTAVIAQTVKGKGVSFMENNPNYHGRAPTPEQMEGALAELA